MRTSESREDDNGGKTPEYAFDEGADGGVDVVEAVDEREGEFRRWSG